MKKILAIMVVVILMINIGYASGTMKMRMQVNNNEYIVAKDDYILTQTFEVSPTLINNILFIPARAFFETLGASVNWKSEAKTIEVKMNTTEILLQEGTSKVIINEQHYEMDQMITVINQKTMIPLSFISRVLDFNVLWDQATNSVTISNNYLDDIEDDIVTYADKVTNIQLVKSIYPSLDYLRNTIVKVWVSNNFERVDFWKMSLQAKEVANVMEQAEMIYQELFPNKYEENKINNAWKYFELVKIGLMQIANGYGEMIDQEKDFLKSVHSTLSDILYYKDQTLEANEYSNLEKMALLLSIIPKPQTDLIITENTIRPPNKLEVSLTMEEAIKYINSDLTVKGYKFDQSLFHLFLVEIDEEEYVVAIHKDYDRISGILSRSSFDYYKQIEFEEVSIP